MVLQGFTGSANVKQYTETVAANKSVFFVFLFFYLFLGTDPFAGFI